jgi:hypothetical protein
MKRQSHVKRLVTAVIAASAAALAGMPANALALGFNFGDLGFFVYGGSTERYENFGTGSTAPVLEGTTVTNRSISADLSVLNVGASAGLRYSIMGSSQDGQSYYVSSVSPSLSAAQISNSSAVIANGEFLTWGFQHAGATGGVADPLANNPSLTQASAAHSFTSLLTNTGTVNGWLGFSTHGQLDQMLTIFRVNVDGATQETYTPVASALLASNGQLTITPAAVPVPAAVILFGTGLAGLVGIARRSASKLAA